jgi:hypothetical protein
MIRLPTQLDRLMPFAPATRTIRDAPKDSLPSHQLFGTQPSLRRCLYPPSVPSRGCYATHCAPPFQNVWQTRARVDNPHCILYDDCRQLSFFPFGCARSSLRPLKEADMRPSPYLRHVWVFLLMLGLSVCAMLLASLVANLAGKPY